MSEPLTPFQRRTRESLFDSALRVAYPTRPVMLSPSLESLQHDADMADALLGKAEEARDHIRKAIELLKDIEKLGSGCVSRTAREAISNLEATDHDELKGDLLYELREQAGAAHSRIDAMYPQDDIDRGFARALAGAAAE